MSDTIPSFDELVEAGGRALYDASCDGVDHVPWGRLPDEIRVHYSDDARAILAAVLPLVTGPAGAEIDRAVAVYDNFWKAEERGYRSRDRQYAIDMLRRARSTRTRLTALAEDVKGGGS
jgi:hypothetical protein